MFATYFLSFCLGMLTFSQGVLWGRLFGFANNYLPKALLFVLMMYLLGTAVGVLLGRKLSMRTKNLWKYSGNILMGASVFGLVAPWLYAYSVLYSDQIIMAGFVMIIMAALPAILLPMVYHLGAPSIGPTVGRCVGRIFAINLFGMAFAPFFVGIILLSAMTTQDCFAVCAELTFLVSLFCLRDEFKPLTWIACSVLAIIILGFIFVQENTQLMGLVAEPRGDISKIIESRHGVVVIYKGIQGDDIVFNDNLYDGRTNLDPVINSNNINRILVLAALNDKPENVLLIGLSIGTWLKLISSFPGVKNIDVVEVNPGLVKAIKDYPQQQSALDDPRVHLHFGHGRLWLRKHPENKYDLIVMNSPFSWRAYATDSLSREFLMLLKQRMRDKAVLAYNSYSSEHEFKTAQTVFSCVHMYENFVIAADFDWRVKIHDASAIKKLAALNFNGKTIFPAGNEFLIKTFLNEFTSDFIDMDVHTANGVVHIRPQVITDDNVLTEYQFGKQLGEKLF